MTELISKYAVAALSENGDKDIEAVKARLAKKVQAQLTANLQRGKSNSARTASTLSEAQIRRIAKQTAEKIFVSHE
jgi:cystathionine beta-lyase family protein involved in aluminum resistance